MRLYYFIMFLLLKVYSIQKDLLGKSKPNPPLLIYVTSSHLLRTCAPRL